PPGHRLEDRLAAVEGIAVGARQALNPFLFQHPIEQPAGATVPIGDEDALDPPGPGGADLAADAFGNLLRIVVPDGRQAGDLQLAPAIEAQAVDNFPAERATGDNEARRRGRRGSR